MAKLYALGDSWGWGWSGYNYEKDEPLPPYRHCSAQILADKLGKVLVNYSMPGNSFPQLTQQFFRRVAPKLLTNDMVFMTIPPDMRWHKCVPVDNHQFNGVNTSHYPWGKEYDEDTISMLFAGGVSNPGIITKDPEIFAHTLESELVQNNYNPYWFKYNTSLQIIALTAYCKLNNVKLFMQHNYGTLGNLLEVTDLDYVLDQHNSMWEWIGLPGMKNMLDITEVQCDGPRTENLEINDLYPIRDLMREKLIPDGEGIDWHPNQSSHRLIGEKLYELCKERMG